MDTAHVLVPFTERVKTGGRGWRGHTRQDSGDARLRNKCGCHPQMGGLNAWVGAGHAGGGESNSPAPSPAER